MTDCLDDNLVVDLLEARLGAAQIERVVQHLDACASCRHVVAQAAREMPVPGAAGGAREAAGAGEGVTRGTCIGRYVVLDRLGVGAMGVVYAAYDPELNRRVALKLLRTDAASSPLPVAELRARLVREAQALARLSHPHVITVYDAGTHEGEVFLAMELVEAGTLTRWLHADKRAPEAVLEMFRQAGEGLAAAHASGIVHRDFKPENVLLGADGRVRVGDFGLARAIGDGSVVPASAVVESAGAPVAPVTATRTGAVVGTPAYMAPEQWQGRHGDARTDVFAFSVALYEGLYGERPFSADSVDGLRDAVGRDEVRPAPAASRVPGNVRRVLLRGLRADPDARFPSMRAMLDELVPRRAGRAWIGAAVVAGGLALTLTALSLRRAPAPACEGAEAAWGDVFDAGHEDAVRRALASPPGPSADAAFATVRRALQQYGQAWIAMHRDACLATRVRGAQSEALLDLRMQCLDERRRAAASFVHSLETGPTEGLAVRAIKAAEDLPRVEDCGDTRALGEPVPMPADPTRRARVVALAGRAAEVEGAALEAGDALAKIEPLVGEAKELAWKPLEARLLYDRATKLSRLRRNREAEAELHDAALAADEAHADGVLLDAWIHLVYVVGYQEYRVSEGLLWSRYAEAALARHGGDERREGLLSSYLGLALLNDETKLDQSRAAFQRALDLATKVDGPQSDEAASAMSELSMVLFTMGQSEQALPFERRSRAIREASLGPESIDIAVSLGNEGEELLESGHVDEALPLLRRSAGLQEKLGRNDAAVLGVVARALRRQGKPDEALDVDRRALALVEKNEPADAYDLSFPAVGIALDLLALGRPADALPYAERGATLRQDATARSERSEARFTLARALWVTGDRTRARAQATDARADCLPTAQRYGGRYARACDEIGAWLDANGG